MVTFWANLDTILLIFQSMFNKLFKKFDEFFDSRLLCLIFNQLKKTFDPFFDKLLNKFNLFENVFNHYLC